MAKIGIFDSGYGGLTVLKEIKKQLPEYSYIYLGDNARTPYGTRSFETVYEYSLEAVKWLFNQGCELVIFACNTASAKALRNIQQNYLPTIDSNKRVLGVIRPVTELINNFTTSNNVGLFATSGTIKSNSYKIEINKLHPDIILHQEACPIWVPLVETNEWNTIGAEYFIQKHCNNILKKSNNIDAIILGCTHYPILIDKIKEFIPSSIKIINQPEIVAESLSKYLKKHTEIDCLLNKNSQLQYYTTDCNETFGQMASIFLNEPITALKVTIH